MTTGPLSGPLAEAMQQPPPPEMPQQSGDEAIAQALGTDTYEPPEISSPDGFVRLPMGLHNHPEFGTVETAVVRELTGHDEEKISRVTGGDNPWRVGAVLLECGVESLGDQPATRKALQALPIGDRDFLLLHIRIMTYGPDVTYDLKCPFCTQQQSVDVDLTSDVPMREVEENPITVDLRDGVKATVWLPTGADDERGLREQVKEGKTDAETDTLLLGNCVESLSNGEVWLGEESARAMGVKDRATVLKAMRDGQPGPDFNQMTVACVRCEEEFGLPVSLVALFR